MTTLTNDEERAAIERQLIAWRAALADAALAVEVHRDVLHSPAESITALEAQAIQAGKAIAYLEAKQKKPIIKLTTSGVVEV